MEKKYKLGISLAGGGARGIAHIGVLQALEENGIYPEAVSGASAGALLGSLYAAGKSPEEIMTIIKTTSLTQILRPSFPSLGLADLSQLTSVLEGIIHIDSFSTLLKPFFVSLTNMSLGKWEIISEGPLFEVIIASCSIPLLFKPREINGMVYVDGGVLNNLPVEPLIENCNQVIGVNVTPIRPESDLNGMLTLGYRTLDLIMWANVEARLKQCNFVIEPNSDDFGLFDIQRADELFELGYKASMERIGEILDRLSLF